MKRGVQEWVKEKFDKSTKKELKKTLCHGSWMRELVVGKVKHEEEIEILRQEGIIINRLKDILAEMAEKQSMVKAAAGADLYDLMPLS